ncbi:hypothetical protein C9374_005675 [Naegleria lovaniensis]|uniref:Uncharacterized protein n=1 Tax=Naegleria lovaniensis TaxID=51637 RepID=A0AA88GPN9_NAELO|nr:uncharacterized protein C9374_005675 [Naegleria lovaniensis]KAG2381883.1 hypothetical protein C9374_005675 [Naegleria lovaniensis]
MKHLFALLLVALLAITAVTAEVSPQADQQLQSFLEGIAEAEEQADFFLTPSIIRQLKEPRFYILTDEELADKNFWGKALKVVGEIGKAAIRDYINKNWDEIPEEEADIKLGKLFKNVLPYLKAAAKQYINQNWDAEELADHHEKWCRVIKCILPYIKRGVKDYIANNWEEEADKGFWKSVWNVVKEIGKGAVKDYVNKNWDNEMELSDKFWKKIWNIVKEVGKGALKSYVNQNFDAVEMADASKFDIRSLIKKALPYIKAGLKEYINKNWDSQELADLENDELADLKLKKLFKKALDVAKNLGKNYIRTQFGIPLEDVPQSDKFFKKLWKVVRDQVKNYIKERIAPVAPVASEESFDEEADAELKFKELLSKALPYLKAGLKEYINKNWDEEQADVIDYEKLFRIALPYLRGEKIIAAPQRG